MIRKIITLLCALLLVMGTSMTFCSQAAAADEDITTETETTVDEPKGINDIFKIGECQVNTDNGIASVKCQFTNPSKEPLSIAAVFEGYEVLQEGVGALEIILPKDYMEPIKPGETKTIFFGAQLKSLKNSFMFTFIEAGSGEKVSKVFVFGENVNFRPLPTDNNVPIPNTGGVVSTTILLCLVVGIISFIIVYNHKKKEV